MPSLSAIPQQIQLQTGNGQNLLSWNLVAGATGYSVQRSTDGVNFTIVGTPAVNYYVDSAVLIGVNYFYSVASVSSAGISGYSPSQPNSITPCAPGQINLGYLRYEAKLRADMLRSNFVTNDEWNLMLNQSRCELYDIMVAKFGEDYFLAPLQVFVTGGKQFYPLPNGTNFLNTNGQPDPNGIPALACYKVYGCDLNSYGANLTNATGWVSMSRFNIADRNKYNLFLGAASNNVSGQYCQFQYREMGTNLEILPINSGQYIRLWYVPIDPQLLLDTDMLPYSYSGWHEYIVVDTAAKALFKRQFYDQAMALKNEKDMLRERIEVTAANRDVGQPNTATNSRSMLGDPNFGGGMFGNGFGGFYGGGGGYGYAVLPIYLLFDPDFMNNNFVNEVLSNPIAICYFLLAVISCFVLFSYLSYRNPIKLSRWVSFSRRALAFFNSVFSVIKNGAKE